MRGGRVYGKGAKGTTMDVQVDKDSNTLCTTISENEISENEITLYSSSSSKVVDDPRHFLDFLCASNGRGVVAKVFTGRGVASKVFTGRSVVAKVFTEADRDTAFASFMREINGIEKISRIYGSRALIEKYTTVTSLTYLGFSFVGIAFVGKLNSWKYATLSRGCDGDAESHPFENLDGVLRFASDVLESLVIVQKNNYGHLDIKPDNVIYCSKDHKFRLIDWEMSKELKYSGRERYYTSPRVSSPLALYLSGIPRMFCIPAFLTTNLVNRALEYDGNFVDSPLFRKLAETIETDFNSMNEILNFEYYFGKYKYHFDLFGVALAIARIVYDRAINYSYVKESLETLIIRMVSLKKDRLDARGALRQLKLIIDDLKT